MDLADIEQGMRLSGVSSGGPVVVVASIPYGGKMANLIYRSGDGTLGEKLVSAEDAQGFEVAPDRRWSFDADGDEFRLASEARRIQWAHLFDPYRRGVLRDRSLTPPDRGGLPASPP